MKILGKDCEVHPDVPEPLPFKKFMVYIGPAMMTSPWAWARASSSSTPA